MTLDGKGKRRKGAQFERDTADALKHIFRDAHRGLQYQDGSKCPDVVAGPYWIECKRGVGGKNPRAAWNQAENDAQPGTIPVAVTKPDREPVLVTMGWEDWVDLVEDAEKWRRRVF